MTRTGQGFTLIELMVTVSMAAILLAVGVPNFSAMINDNRMATTTNKLVSALNLARSEAIKRGLRVTLCKSADGSSCTTSGNWEQGWIVFTDLDADGDFSDDGDSDKCEAGEECLLRFFEAVPNNFTLRTGNNFSDWVSYLPSGRSRGNGGLANDTFRLCYGSDTSNARAIAINVTGRISVSKGTASCP